MTRKFTLDEVRQKFEERGWKLTDTEYLGSQVPLKATCPEGHDTTITWNNFQRGQGCKFCARNVKYDFEIVKRFFQEKGYELLETEYSNNNQPLKYRCVCGEVSTLRVCDLLKNRIACPTCKKKMFSQLNMTPREEIEALCTQHGCTLIDSFIYKKRTRIQYICKCGEIAETYLCNFKNYPNCWKCSIEKKSGNKCHLWNPDREAVALNKKYQKTCGRLLYRALKATGLTKSDHTYKLLGYTAKQLQEHIQSHPDYRPDMNMHIDHIFPIKAFIDHGVFDLKLINALDNLRPMEGIDNVAKGDYYDKELFLEWLRNKQK